MKIIISLFLVLSFLGLEASAQSKKKYKKRQEVSFDGADVDGISRNPNASYLVQRRGVDFLPLYKVRESFDQSIKESIDYLR